MNYHYDATLTQDLLDKYISDFAEAEVTDHPDTHLYHLKEYYRLCHWSQDKERDHDTSYHFSEDFDEPMIPAPSNRTDEYYENFFCFLDVNFIVLIEAGLSKKMPSSFECQDNTSMTNVTFPDVTVKVTGNDVTLENLTFKDGGNISILGDDVTGTKMRGSLTFGGTLRTNKDTVDASGLSVTLDLTKKTGTEKEPMIDSLSHLVGAKLSKVLVKQNQVFELNQAPGSYYLASGAASFEDTIAVNDLGNIAVGDTLRSDYSIFILRNAGKILSLSVYMKNDLAAAESVIYKIYEIGNVSFTAQCKALIDKAREAFDNLTDDQKVLVSNKNVLEAAEASYAAMKSVVEADMAAANDVIVLIYNIGIVDNTSDCKSKIDEARNAYDSLTYLQKSYVTNIETLLDAESQYAAILSGVNAPLQDSFVEDTWYRLDGSKLSGRPTETGVYIHNGRNFLIP